MLVDSHCHLDDAKFDLDRQEIIDRALAAGVGRILTIGTGDGPPDLEVALRLAVRYPHVSATIGVHPHHAAQATPDTWRELRRLASDPHVAAIGEIGLDYHYDFAPRDVQRDVFAAQLAIAAEAGKPVIIHTREAWPDTLAVLERHWHHHGLPGVMHCFSGGLAEAEQCLALGFTLSFAGPLTFPKSLELKEVAKLVPVSRMLVETDAPYLAPVPYRGKRNEPAYVVETARTLAALRGVTLEQVASETTENFNRLFSATSNGTEG